MLELLCELYSVKPFLLPKLAFGVKSILLDNKIKCKFGRMPLITVKMITAPDQCEVTRISQSFEESAAVYISVKVVLYLLLPVYIN